MSRSSFEIRRRAETLGAADLANHQLAKLNSLLNAVLPANAFYRHKLGELQLPLASLDAIYQFPDTLKHELVSGVSPPDFAANRTYDLTTYSRFHRTSGTHGRPMVVVDTDEDWQWWIETWQYVLDTARVEPSDRVFMAFSFGPFIGFWSAFDAIASRGALTIPGGGMSSRSRLNLIESSGANVMCCTPTYAMHLAEVAVEHGRDVGKLGIERMIVAGEPGGSVPAIRARIESTWNCHVIDHSGATEIGPWGYANADGSGLHVIETEFIAEFRSVETGQIAGEGDLAELVLTTLGRTGCPLIRYRTGDLVRPSWNLPGTNRFVFLEGGVLGRVDDMMVIRGVNVYPSAVEQILHSLPEVVEYRMTAFKSGAMDALRVEVEDRLSQPERIADELKVRLGLKVDVRCVELGSLPRFEGKGKRFLDERATDA